MQFSLKRSRTLKQESCLQRMLQRNILLLPIKLLEKIAVCSFGASYCRSSSGRVCCTS